jgi:hypothetical protein
VFEDGLAAVDEELELGRVNRRSGQVVVLVQGPVDFSDQEPPALEHNFNLVKARLGFTTHVRERTTPSYDWQGLMNLFVKADYKGGGCWKRAAKTRPTAWRR